MTALGTVVIADPRLGIDRHLTIKTLDLRHGVLHIEASTVVPVGGTVQEDDIVSIYDPAGTLTTRFWATFPSPCPPFEAGDRFTLVLPIPLGGPRGIAFADSTINVDL